MSTTDISQDQDIRAAEGEELKLRPFGLNLPDQYSWPSRRSLPRYEEMTDLPISKILDSGDTWIDIGPGTNAQALGAMSGQGVHLVGITPHKMEIPHDVIMHAGFVPDNTEFLDSYLLSSDLVTDIYAAFSYADDPLKVLIYETMLLKDGGIYRAVSETERFGDTADHARMIEFAEKCLGVKLSFAKFLTFADANQEWEYELRISGKRIGQPISYDIDTLMELGQSAIGIPQKSEEPLFVVEHKDHQEQPLGEIYGISFLPLS